jgi:hypothetical protein
LIGVGAADITSDTWRNTGARAREATAIGAGEIRNLVRAGQRSDNAAGALVEGALLASYQFNKYRSNSRAPAE